MDARKEPFTVVSPSGLTIHFAKTHDTPEPAREAFEERKSNYGVRGYYPTVKN